MSSSLKKISIVILVHNHEHISRFCLNSLLNSRYRPLQIVLVDNGSSLAVGRMLERFARYSHTLDIETDIVRFDTNNGTIYTRNAALERCNGEWIAFLDNDTILRDCRMFEKMTHFLDSHPEVGIVAPKFVYAAAPYRIQSAGGGVTRDGTCYLIGRGADRAAPEFSCNRSVPWVLSACMLMSANLVNQLGSLDTRFHPVGFEDVDYCFRARVRGLEVVYLADTEIYHVECTTTGSAVLGPKIRLARRNKRMFRKKWGFLFPKDMAIEDIAYAYSEQPRVPLHELHNLPCLD